MDQFTAQQILKVRDALVEKDINEAYHQLYKIASPDFDKMCDEVWTQIESRASEEPALPTPVEVDFEKAMTEKLDTIEENGIGLDSRWYNFEVGARWARQHLASIPPADGPWHLKSHNNSEDDDTVWMTDGKLSIYIDEFNFDDFPEADYWLVNFMNKYQFKLSFDDQSPLIISHLEEQVKELQGRKGLRWILAEKDNLPQGRYADFQWRYADTKAPILISQFYPADYGKYEYLSDSPAPEQVDADSMLSDAIKKAKAFSESIPDGEDKQLAHHAFMIGYAANVNGPKYLEMKNALQTAHDCMEWMWANMTLPDGRKHLQSDAFNIPANAISIAQDALGIAGKSLMGDDEYPKQSKP